MTSLTNSTVKQQNLGLELRMLIIKLVVFGFRNQVN